MKGKTMNVYMISTSDDGFMGKVFSTSDRAEWYLMHMGMWLSDAEIVSVDIDS